MLIEIAEAEILAAAEILAFRLLEATQVHASGVLTGANRMRMGTHKGRGVQSIYKNFQTPDRPPLAAANW